jgi:hypothetical protein
MLKKPFTKKNRAGGVAQGEDPEFKPQYCKKKKKKKRQTSLPTFPVGLCKRLLLW